MLAGSKHRCLNYFHGSSHESLVQTLGRGFAQRLQGGGVRLLHTTMRQRTASGGGGASMDRGELSMVMEGCKRRQRCPTPLNTSSRTHLYSQGSPSAEAHPPAGRSKVCASFLLLVCLWSMLSPPTAIERLYRLFPLHSSQSRQTAERMGVSTHSWIACDCVSTRQTLFESMLDVT